MALPRNARSLFYLTGCRDLKTFPVCVIRRVTVSCGIKPVIHFTRIVAKRSVVLSAIISGVERTILTQKNVKRYVAIRLT